ncbi:MAG: heme-binding domain-containing protein [Ekhidna sp.]|uniref:heme-binding domain-containing protein n=1 Tax=Ekhidna sp. TaxID=2608089 RepID=UPI0032EBE67E
MIKKILLLLVVCVIVLQFFRGSEPEVRFDNPDDIFLHVEAPDQVKNIMRTACYDCHSMETKYPWYTWVTPVSWWVFEHIEHGRDELNFSEWANFEKRRKVHKLKEIAEEVGEGEMPLESYQPMHPEAKLTQEQRDLLIEWSKGLAAQMQQGAE